MSLAPGTRLGPYEIVEPLGKGGMGEVFKAKDTRLDRLVAIKILPAEWAQDAGMKERFNREAQAIASLNHPNICALHDIGTVAPAVSSASPAPPSSAASVPSVSYLVMELLSGETLAARIARGALSLDEALDVAVPIADALDQAHRRGVIHRDLKPGNIMLTKAGPKLLDFGLARTPATTAKRTSGSGESGTVAAVPTMPLTTPGLLIGTLQYMAPEQLDGFEADARTDIFAFGTVLHEMVTGKRAFQGKSQVLLISAIATSEPPPLSTAEPNTPPALDHVVKTCLAKNPDDRWQTARDLLAELRWIAEGGAAATAIMPAGATSRRPSNRTRFISYGLTAAALVAAGLLAGPAYSYFQTTPAPPETRFRVWETPFDATPHTDGYFAISPDGRNLVHRADEDNINDPQGLYVSRVGELSFRRLPGTDEPTQPFWSPAGDAIAFVAGGNLLRVPVAGGPPQVISSAKGMMGGDWNADGTILFGSSAGIYRVSAEGGTPDLILARTDKETGLYWPHFLPDGRRFLYLSWSAEPPGRALMAASLDDPKPRKIMAAESNAAYTTAGHLVFHRGDAVYAQPFDLGTLTVSGEPTRIAAQVLFTSTHGLGAFGVSRDGVLIYGQNDPLVSVGGGAQELRLWQPAWVDRSGRELGKVGSYQMYRGAEVSPDGTRIALHRHDEKGGDVWIIEASGSDTRLTFDPERDNSAPIWSPNGEHIVFGARRADKWALIRRLSDGRGTEDVLHESDQPIVPMSWSPDGLRIVFGRVDSQTNGDLWVLTLESADGAPSKTAKPEVFVSTPLNETHGQISPNGRWIAYASNETKTDQYEIYVRPFPAGAGRWQVSPTGGDFPRWSRDGSELFFVANSVENFTSPNTLMSVVKVNTKGDTFTHGAPAPFMALRTVNLSHPGGDYPTYAFGKDGKMLVFIWANAGPVGATTTVTVTAPDQEGGLTIARHWEQALKKRK